MKEIFEAVREASSPESWSRGVELARAGAVHREPSGEGTVLIRVVTRGGIYCPAVTLYLEDADWECSCGARSLACAHAAAAVIALRHAGEEGLDVPAAGTRAGRLSYRFTGTAGGLVLDRFIVVGDEAHPLEASLASIAAGRAGGPRFAASQADLRVEMALGTHHRGPVPRSIVARLLDALSGCAEVLCDGEPVRTSASPVVPVATLDEQGDGFRLSVGRDPSVAAVFANGIALAAGVLRPVDEARLTARELHELPRGKQFGPGDVAELVTEVLPSLRKRVPVEIRTDRLPQGTAMPPRIAFDLTREERSLSVLALLVYGDPPCARVDGGRLVHLGGAVPIRNEGQEKRLLATLGRELDLAPGVRARFDGEAAVAFAERLAAWGPAPKRRELEYFRRTPPLVPRIGTESGRVDVAFEVPGGTGRAEAGAVLRAWREGASLVPLDGGGFSPLPLDWLARYGERIADLLAARDPQGGTPRCALPDLARLCDDLGQPRPPDFKPLSALLAGFAGIPESPLPRDLTATLRAYQRRGIDWLAFLRGAGLGALLADDMGLGKTLQALCALEGRTLVVAPTSVLHNWEEEIRRFRPGLSSGVYHGERRTLAAPADVTLTTYAILRLDAEALSREAWDTVILDEAQAIKNPDSLVARAAFALTARFRIALTGTPVENRLDELWSQIHFLNRGLLGGRDDFEARYARPVAAGAPGAAARLRERIRPFVLRRLKQEVAPELPPRSEAELRCQLSPHEREVYDTVRAATLPEVVERLHAGGGVLQALEALLRLRQAACHSGLIPGREAETSSKVALLLEALDEVVAEGHKALVFSQWTSLLDRVEPHLGEAGIAFVRLDGSTRDRAEVVARFQDDAGPPVMLVSLKAGGTGLNLTAADHVFLLDPWWNPAVEDQAADRAHRIGQERPVMVYRLIAEDTVEERIQGLKGRKRALADAALGEADRAAGLTREDLLALLE
ncbi:MAG: DEAD/DEAH box helicase [Acidobacteriia bacterium]|nr:DEAD/DEAH box helicase [Terriglobia bacterium]